VTSEAKKRNRASIDDVLIEVETVSYGLDLALSMRLSTSTREDIDSRTTEVIGYMRMLLAEDLGADRDPETLALFRACYYLLDLTRRPTPRTPAYDAFQFLRDVTSRTRSLLKIYMQQKGIRLP
jgi:hypothetical protein